MEPHDPSLRPILACRVESDGEGVVHLRVYCPRAGTSVPVGTCEACAEHIELPDGASPGQVRCGPAAEEACAQLAEAPPIGALVKSSVRAVDEGASLSSVEGLLAGAGAEPVLVVDVAGVCVGVLSRVEVLRRLHVPRRITATLTVEVELDVPAHERPTARDVMAQATVAMESANVREVLRRMAAHRLRFLAIVASDGTPLGMISDIEALRLFAALRR